MKSGKAELYFDIGVSPNEGVQYLFAFERFSHCFKDVFSPVCKG